ncbi:hypothetical protein MNBD_NITROSPINAE02-137 [hydrothermal vent metagenome]|uniref:TIGR00725 family protein n=1 Tax=hydrothermal vent metagenome TaxID=652676 RepID=A0A3B1CK36_9ZZZZ
MPDSTIIIGVIGAGSCTADVSGGAQKVGELIAGRGAMLVCGGLGGVMESAAKGAFSNGGVTIGILPGDNKDDRSPYISIPIVTDMGHARNVIIAQTADGLIAIEGGSGTLSEIAISMKLGKPVVSIGKWSQMEGVIAAQTPEEAVEKVFKLIG